MMLTPSMVIAGHRLWTGAAQSLNEVEPSCTALMVSHDSGGAPLMYPSTGHLAHSEAHTVKTRISDL